LGKNGIHRLRRFIRLGKEAFSSPDLRNLCNRWIAFFLPNDTSTDVRLLLKINAKIVKLMSVVDVDPSFRSRG